MSPIKKTILAAVAAALAASTWQFAGLRARTAEAARLRMENVQLRLQASQRYAARTRAATGAVGAATPAASGTSAHREPVAEREVAKSAAANTATDTAQSARSNYRNEGQATPQAALQTFAWACDQGDVELMKRLLIYDPIARKKAENYFASLPPGERPEGAVEEIGAALYLSYGMEHPFPGAEMLEKARFEPVREGRVVLHLPHASGDGYVFDHTNDGWKVVVTEQVVEAYIEEHGAPVSRGAHP